jgi:exosortase
MAVAVAGLTLWVLAWALEVYKVVRLHAPGTIPPWHIFMFPVAFIGVAVPWPYTWSEPLIQALTRFNTWLAVELLALTGIPALPHGNVIELATGQVGVNEACSGIRSLQGTLMLALFFGEMYDLPWRRRLGVLGAGFALALTGNLARTFLLTWVAAREGEAAIQNWHDPAGATVLALTCAGVWLLSWALARRPRRHDAADPPSTRDGDRASAPSVTPLEHPPVNQLEAMLRRWRAVGWIGLIWVAAVEAGVAGWYAWVESNRTRGPDWQLVWPRQERELAEIEVGRAARELLQYDEGRQVRWRRADGTVCQMSWFRWRPGRAAAYLAKSHSPVVCMPAAGFPLEWVSEVRWLETAGLRIPYRLYRFGGDVGPVHVWYTRWEEGVVEQSFAHETAGPWSRLSSIWTGPGRRGQRVLVVAIWGVKDAAEAERRLCEELKSRVHVGEDPVSPLPEVRAGTGQGPLGLVPQGRGSGPAVDSRGHGLHDGPHDAEDAKTAQ